MIYWNTAHKEWDFVIFLVSEAFVFILFPLLTKNKQTVGMLALKLYLQDRKGQCVKTSKVLLHNLFVGIWLYFYNGMPCYSLGIILFQALFIIWLFVMIVKSLLQRKVCYYWEPWLDTYIRADVSNRWLDKSVSVNVEE